MPTKERAWYLERLNRQLTDENKARADAGKKAQAGTKKPSKGRRR